LSQILYSNTLSLVAATPVTVALDLKKGSAGNYTVQGAAGAPTDKIKYILSAHASAGKATIQVGANTTHKIAIDTDTSYVSTPLLWVLANYLIVTAVDDAATVNLVVEEVV